MKKLSVMLLAAIVLLAACGGKKVDESQAKAYTEKAKEAVTLLNEEKFDEMRMMFDDEMKDALPVEQLQEVSDIVKESGEFASFEKSSVAEQEGYYVVTLAAKYSEDNRVYTITFNDQKELAGFFVK